GREVGMKYCFNPEPEQFVPALSKNSLGHPVDRNDLSMTIDRYKQLRNSLNNRLVLPLLRRKLLLQSLVLLGRSVEEYGPLHPFEHIFVGERFCNVVERPLFH